MSDLEALRERVLAGETVDLAEVAGAQGQELLAQWETEAAEVRAAERTAQAREERVNALNAAQRHLSEQKVRADGLLADAASAMRAYIAAAAAHDRSAASIEGRAGPLGIRARPRRCQPLPALAKVLADAFAAHPVDDPTHFLVYVREHLPELGFYAG